MQNDDEISTSPRGLGILYITVLAENCQNLKRVGSGPGKKILMDSPSSMGGPAKNPDCQAPGNLHRLPLPPFPLVGTVNHTVCVETDIKNHS